MKASIGLLAPVPEKGALGKSSKGAPAPESDPELMAAEDMISAQQDGDAEALKAAFKRMYNACAAASKSEEESEGESEDYPSFT